MSKAEAEARLARSNRDWRKTFATAEGRRVLEEIRMWGAGDPDTPLPYEGAEASHAIGGLRVARRIEARICELDPAVLGQMRVELTVDPTPPQAKKQPAEAEFG